MTSTSRILAGLVVVPFLLGAAASPVTQARVLFSFQDNEIIESSGLAVVDGLVLTTNDSGDSGRVFAVDPATGETVSVTRWDDDPADVEALAPDGGPGVWVGDIGDNPESRDSIQLVDVPIGRGDRDVDPEVHEVRYPDGAHDAETLMRDPTAGRLYVATKSPLGGILYEVPKSGAGEMRPLGDVLPLATDGAFFPDGRHFVLRNYALAAVYAFPSLESVGSFRLPSQPKGEGIAVDDHDRLLLSSEGLHSDVLRVSLPDDVRAAMAGGTPSAAPSATGSPAPSPATPSPSTPSPSTPSPSTQSREDSELPETTETQRPAWPWLLSGLIGVGIVVVLLRSLRRR
jgi:hypothetical protein